MASKKKGEVHDLTTRILIEIRDEAKRTNARLDETNARLEVLTARVDTLTIRVDTGFAQLNARLDNFIEIAGERYRDLDARVRVLESRQH